MLEVLKRCSIFTGLPNDSLESLEKLATEESKAAGTNLIRGYEANDFIWVMIDGTAAVRDVLDDGTEFDLYRLKPGDVFGEISFIDSAPASATVAAVTEVTVLKISSVDLRNYLASKPDVENKILKRLVITLSQRLRRANTALRDSIATAKGA